MSRNETAPSVVVTIDGPAGAGKSTVARSVAARLGFSFLDTGAMYRALTLKALREKVNLEDEDELVRLARETELDLQDGPQGLRVIVDGEDVSEEIRSSEVTNKTFYIARAGSVRSILVEWQRRIARSKNVVAEGRDTGSVVFPDAPFKFYLDADVEERMRRRRQELEAKGQAVDPQVLLKEIQDRDHRDQNRAVGPLIRPAHAVVIDSTRHSAEEVIETILTHVRQNGSY